MTTAKRYVLIKADKSIDGFSCSTICARTNNKKEAEKWKTRWGKSRMCSVYDLIDKRPLIL